MFSNETRMLSRICDRRSPFTLSTVQICATATDRPTDRVRFLSFEENAGFAVRSRTQTIARESNVVFFICFQIRHHHFRTQRFLLYFSNSATPLPNADVVFGRGRIEMSQKGRGVVGCHLPKLTVLTSDNENSKERWQRCPHQESNLGCRGHNATS